MDWDREREEVWEQFIKERIKGTEYEGSIDYKGKEYPYKITVTSIVAGSVTYGGIGIEGKFRFTEKLPPRDIRLLLAKSALETFIEDRLAEIKDKTEISIKGKHQAFPFLIVVKLWDNSLTNFPKSIEQKAADAVRKITTPSFNIEFVHFEANDLPIIRGEVTLTGVTDSKEAILPEIRQLIEDALMDVGVYLENIELEESSWDPSEITVKVEGKWTGYFPEGDIHPPIGSGGYYEIYEASINKKAFLKNLLHKLEIHGAEWPERVYRFNQERYEELLNDLSPEEKEELSVYFDRREETLDSPPHKIIVLTPKEITKKLLSEVVDVEEYGKYLDDLRNLSYKISMSFGIRLFYDQDTDTIKVPKKADDKFQEALKELGLNEVFVKKGEGVCFSSGREIDCYIYGLAPDVDYKVPEIRYKRFYTRNHRVPRGRVHIMKNKQKGAFRRKAQDNWQKILDEIRRQCIPTLKRLIKDIRGVFEEGKYEKQIRSLTGYTSWEVSPIECDREDISCNFGVTFEDSSILQIIAEVSTEGKEFMGTLTAFYSESGKSPEVVSVVNTKTTKDIIDLDTMLDSLGYSVGEFLKDALEKVGKKNKRVISSYRRKKEGSYRMRNKPRRVFIKKRQPKKASIEKEAKWVDWYEYIDPITGRRVIKQADVSQPPDKIIEDEIIELRGDMNDLFKKMLGRMNREITALKKEVARLGRQREILKRRAFKESNFEKWVNYWNSLTGDAEHKFKQCVKKVSEAGFAKDPKKFCGGLRNFVEGTTERKRSSKRTVTLRDVLRRRAALRKLRAMKRKAAEEVTITTDDGRKVKVLVRNASFKPVRAEAEEQQAPVTPPEPPKQPITHDEVKEVAEQATPQQQPNNNESVSLRDTIVHQLAAIFGVPSDSVRILNAEVTQPAKEDGNLIITITYKVGEEGAKKTAHVLVTKKTAIIKAANITSKVNFNGKKVLYDIPTKTIINEKGEIVTGEEKPMVAVAPSDVDVPAGFTDIAVENALTVESNNPTTPNIAVSASTSKDPELVRLATIVTDTLIRKGILEPDRRKEQIQVYLAHYDDPNALKSILNVLNKIGDGDTIYVNEKGVPVDLKDIF